MSVAALGVCLLSVLSLRSLEVLALDACDQNIISRFNAFGSICYFEGPPRQWIPQPPWGVRHTHILASRVDLPENTKCMSSFLNQREFKGYTTFVLNDMQQLFPPSYSHDVKDGYIQEIDSSGVSYKLYVIKNAAHVYSYYRCIDSPGALGNGEPSVGIAVNCKVLNTPVNAKTRKDASTIANVAWNCFYKLGITNVVRLEENCICE